PRIGDRTWLGHDRGRRAGTDGAGAFALQEGQDVRGLSRSARAGAAGEETLAKARRQSRGEVEGRVGGGLRGSRRRKQQEAQGPAARRPAGEERERVPGWLPAMVG